MASKRRIRRRSCEGKKPYPTKELADRACKLLLKYKEQRCVAYPCKFGNHFHVGHYKKNARISFEQRTGRVFI